MWIRPRYCTPALLLTVALVTMGCDFFNLPEPDDGVLTCGETLDIAPLAEASGYLIDASSGTTLELTWDFASPDDAIRLQFIDGDVAAGRATSIIDGPNGRRTLSAFLPSGRTAAVDFLFVSAAPEGTITLNCITPGEDCGNLADDDGDGAIDCADVNCARDAGCVDGQADFDTSTAPCTDGWEPLEVPELRSFSSQRTVYRLIDEDDRPVEEFWGGAETTIVSSVNDRFVQIRSASGGLACLSQDQGTHQVCMGGTWERLGGDDPFVVADSDLPVLLEPPGLAWTDLEIRVDCGAEE